MLLKAASAFSLLNIHGEKNDISPLFSSLSSPVSIRKSGNLSFALRATKGSSTLSGVVFEPFEEVKKELDLVPSGQQLSLARHLYSPECEAAVNEQIKYVFSFWFETF